MGNLSKPFTKDDVIKYEGSAHGQASTYALFSAIATDIHS
jgi:hypothetical protein